MGYVVANLILLLSCKENTLTFLDGNISISQTYIVWVIQEFFFNGSMKFLLLQLTIYIV